MITSGTLSGLLHTQIFLSPEPSKQPRATHKINCLCDTSQVLVAEAQSHDDKVKQLNDTVEKLQQICDPQQVKEKAASVTELHKGMRYLSNSSGSPS